jgi:hypothetical protein
MSWLKNCSTKKMMAKGQKNMGARKKYMESSPGTQDCGCFQGFLGGFTEFFSASVMGMTSFPGFMGKKGGPFGRAISADGVKKKRLKKKLSQNKSFWIQRNRILSDRQRLSSKIVGKDCRQRLSAKTVGKDCRQRLPGAIEKARQKGKNGGRFSCGPRFSRQNTLFYIKTLGPSLGKSARLSPSKNCKLRATREKGGKKAPFFLASLNPRPDFEGICS